MYSMCVSLNDSSKLDLDIIKSQKTSSKNCQVRHWKCIQNCKQNPAKDLQVQPAVNMNPKNVHERSNTHSWVSCICCMWLDMSSFSAVSRPVSSVNSPISACCSLSCSRRLRIAFASAFFSSFDAFNSKRTW